MKFKLRLVSIDEDGQENRVDEIAILEKDFKSIEHLGLNLAESKALLKEIQKSILSQQFAAYLKTSACCQNCGVTLRTKGHLNVTFRTLFGNYVINSARLRYCNCQPHDSLNFSPLSSLLTKQVSPELLFIETRWSSLVSYGITPKALKDFLPIDEKLNTASIRNHTLQVACSMRIGIG
jgi:hypothetical protein